jgi:hypothetical protein
MNYRARLVLEVLFICFSLCVVAPRLSSAQPAAVATTAITDPDNRITFSLGYSFGWANFTTSTPTNALLGETSGNEPLLGLSAEYGRNSRLLFDFKLALANFGRLIDTTENITPTADSTATDVRRSVITDASARWRFTSLASKNAVAGFLTLNTGIILDAQSEDPGTHIDDASSYLFIGPSLIADFDRTEFLLDLLVGQSEVMTNVELFAKKWDTDTLRVKPRIRLSLLPDDNAQDTKKSGMDFRPLILGLWCDLGVSESTADTYVLFVSKPVWSTDSP